MNKEVEVFSTFITHPKVASEVSAEETGLLISAVGEHLAGKGSFHLKVLPVSCSCSGVFFSKEGYHITLKHWFPYGH